MTRLYLGCALRISISTTIVFCILVETTMPTFSLRRVVSGAAAVVAGVVSGVFWVSAMIMPSRFLLALSARALGRRGVLDDRVGGLVGSDRALTRDRSWCGRYPASDTRSFLTPSWLPRLFWKRRRKSCSAALLLRRHQLFVTQVANLFEFHLLSFLPERHCNRLLWMLTWQRPRP